MNISPACAEHGDMFLSVDSRKHGRNGSFAEAGISSYGKRVHLPLIRTVSLSPTCLLFACVFVFIPSLSLVPPCCRLFSFIHFSLTAASPCRYTHMPLCLPRCRSVLVLLKHLLYQTYFPPTDRYMFVYVFMFADSWKLEPGIRGDVSSLPRLFSSCSS